MATGTIIKTRKSKVIHYPIENISVGTAWGSIFYRTLPISISVSGTIKGALVSFVGANGDLATVSLASITNSIATILFVRGASSSGLNGTVTLEVFYE